MLNEIDQSFIEHYFVQLVEAGWFVDDFPECKRRDGHFLHLCEYCHEHRHKISLKRAWSLSIWFCPSVPLLQLSAMKERRISSRSLICPLQKTSPEFFRDELTDMNIWRFQSCWLVRRTLRAATILKLGVSGILSLH